MPSLRDLQQAFRGAMLSGQPEALRGLVEDNGLTGEERVRVYVNNVRLGFRAALAAAFPIILKLGGDDWFTSIAWRYQQTHPCRCGDLQYAGDRFAAYLLADLGDGEYRWFADVARLEWAYQESLVAREDAPLDPASLHAVDEEHFAALNFQPRATVRLVRAETPLLALWRSQQDTDPQPVDLTAGSSHVLLIRRADHVELRELPEATWCLLEVFGRGATLGGAADDLLRRHADFDLQSALRSLVQLQVFTAIHVTDRH
jgi:hypothetical protein